MLIWGRDRNHGSELTSGRTRAPLTTEVTLELDLEKTDVQVCLHVLQTFHSLPCLPWCSAFLGPPQKEISVLPILMTLHLTSWAPLLSICFLLCGSHLHSCLISPAGGWAHACCSFLASDVPGTEEALAKPTWGSPHDLANHSLCHCSYYWPQKLMMVQAPSSLITLVQDVLE